MTTATLELPWPDKRLSPNARMHHMALAKARKASKQATQWECIAQCVPRGSPLARVSVGYVFLPPDGRRRDLDNVIGTTKAISDGIAAHIGVDDSKWTLAYEFGEPVKGGKVIVNLRWQET